MPDISKCNGKDCPIKEKCFRYTSNASMWQAWHPFKYDNGCDAFEEILLDKERTT